LFSFFEGEDIESEYTKKPPAPHETVSALLLLNQYSDQITQMGGDPNLAARMIMGCRHQTGRQTPKKHFENRLISLLNGSAFDVDSLDYIQRDSWASGVSNVEIDYQRLLSALMIKTDNKTGVLQVFFKKSALSVLENVSIGRNFLYKWIYSHHKVQYEQRLLEKIIKEIDTLSNGEFCEKIFSVEALIGDVCFNNLKYYLPTDDDVIHTIKSFKGTVPEIDEYLSREYKYKAIWKTFFEFNEVYFANISDSNKMQIAASLNKGHLNDKYENRIFCIIVEPKMKSIPSNDFFIDIDGQTIDAAKTTSLAGQNLKYFIAYVTPDLLNCKNSIISDLHSLQV
jgi:HD superfamily phosphohydrolase